MNDVISTLRNMLWNIVHRMGVTDILDILLVAVVLYELIRLLRHTRGSALLKGVVAFLLIALASNILGFTALNWLLMIILNNGALVLVILFQPELRKILESMGRNSLFEGRFGKNSKPNDSTAHMKDEIIQCMMDLSRRRVGALIVFEQKTGLQDVIETGTAIDAEISAPLLENIFEPNTPLHDGAVVIRGNRVQAAACILTLTEASGVSRELGTRHRAAIGISENTDAIVFVVSEETGTMSMAQQGNLNRPMNEESLREVLDTIYNPENNGFAALIRAFFKGKEEAES